MEAETAAKPVEHTTQLALNEKSKLKKSMRRFDMLFFNLRVRRARHARDRGERRRTGLHLADRARRRLRSPVRARHVGGRQRLHAGRRPIRVDEARLGRLHAGIAAVFYWITNPLWVGGSLAFIATSVEHGAVLPDIGGLGDYVFGLPSSGSRSAVAIVALRRGKWIPTAGAIARCWCSAFSRSRVLYAASTACTGSRRATSRRRRRLPRAGSRLLFNYVGFELQNGAAEEMVNPQRDVRSPLPAGAHRRRPLLRDPDPRHPARAPSECDHGLGGFIDADQTVFTVYGGALERCSRSSHCASSSR